MTIIPEGFESQFVARTRVHVYWVQDDGREVLATGNVPLASCFPGDTEEQERAVRELHSTGRYMTGGGAAPLSLLTLVPAPDDDEIERTYQQLTAKLTKITRELIDISHNEVGVLHLRLAARLHTVTNKAAKLTRDLQRDVYWPHEVDDDICDAANWWGKR